MTARGDFEIGQRVEMTEYGVERLVRNTTKHRGASVTTGVIVGFGKKRDTIRVLRDEHVCPDSYHPAFWQQAVAAKTEGFR